MNRIACRDVISRHSIISIICRAEWKNFSLLTKLESRVYGAGCKVDEHAL